MVPAVSVYAAFAIVITLGVATLGNMLVTALLVLPALLGNVKCGGILRYNVSVTIIGAAGSIFGFLVALGIDVPPAINASVGIGVVGMCIRLLFKRK
jgi:ABC-type Mn2+/Zn2+ transport system permease subunit